MRRNSRDIFCDSGVGVGGDRLPGWGFIPFPYAKATFQAILTRPYMLGKIEWI